MHSCVRFTRSRCSRRCVIWPGLMRRRSSPSTWPRCRLSRRKASRRVSAFRKGSKSNATASFCQGSGGSPFASVNEPPSVRSRVTSRTFTVRFDAGTWYVSFQIERDVAETVHGKAGTIVGIDVGVARFAALRDGTVIEGANAFEKHKKRLAFLQRRLARTVKNSANWRKAKARITKIHKASTTIGKKPRGRRDGRPVDREHDQERRRKLGCAREQRPGQGRPQPSHLGSGLG